VSDGQLRQIFRKHLPEAHWQPIETWSTGQGVPDVEYCFPGGACGWIENKATQGWKVDVRPHQVAWIERRVRSGGRVFVAVRRKSAELYLIRGADVRRLSEEGLMGIDPILGCEGGPARWSWGKVREILTA
jgi:hypothetical protein